MSNVHSDAFILFGPAVVRRGRDVRDVTPTEILVKRTP